MAIVRLPDATWPPPGGDPSPPSPETPVDTPQQASVIQQTLSGSDTVIPIIYGRARVGGLISLATTYNSKLVLCVVWCMGEVNSISVRINDEAPPAGVTITSYRGTTTQTVDPTLAAAIPGFSDNLVYVDPKYGSVGIAYSVVQIPANLEEINGFPSISADIEGRKVYCCVAGTKTYTNNPGAVLADLLTDPILGMRRPIDFASQTAVTQACAELVGTKPRRAINLALTNAQETTQWIETLRGYAGCYLFYDGDKAVLVPNRPPAAITPISTDAILKGSLKVRKATNPPNVVRVSYTDISAEPWRTNYAIAIHSDVASGVLSWNEESVAMPGIHEYAQAYREAEERLKAYTYAQTEIEFVMLDEGLQFTVGEVIAFNHPSGFTNEPFRIVALDSVDSGRWRVVATGYSSSLYSDADPSTPPFPKVDPPDSGDPTITNPPTSLSLSQIFSTLSDGTPISKIQATWSASPGINFSYYEIQWGQGSSPTRWNGDKSTTTSWLSPQVTPNQTYTVKVRIVATDNAVGAWASSSIYITGKTSNTWTPPSTPSGTGTSLSLTFTWQFNASATDIMYTEVRMASVNSFASAAVVATVPYPLNSYTVTGLLAGTCRYFWARFFDTSGNATGYYPSSGGSGVTLCTPAASSDAQILSYLQNKISSSQLVTSLSSTITQASEDATTAIQEVTNLQAEIGGEYYVKIQTDVNGNPRVAGFGLSNLVGEPSQFIVLADRFAVVNPASSNGTARIPFIVDSGQVYMEGAYIKNLSVDNAKIANLTLTTGKISAGNQITAANTVYTSTEYTWSSPTGTTRSLGSFSLSGAYTYIVDFQLKLSCREAVYQAIGDDGQYTPPNGTVTLLMSGGFSQSYTIPINLKTGNHVFGCFGGMSSDANRSTINLSVSLTLKSGAYSYTLSGIPGSFAVPCYTSYHWASGVAYKR